MKILRLLLNLCLLFFINSQVCYADGLQLDSGRYAGGGAVLELKLNLDQLKTAEKIGQEGVEIVLDRTQVSLVKTTPGLDKAPTKLWITTAQNISGDCTCGLVNFGLLFKPGWIEVPKNYLVSDEEAEQRKIID